MISDKIPVLICENSRVIASGRNLLSAFDRLEVTEATARSIISARQIGPLVMITDDGIEDINKAFNITS